MGMPTIAIVLGCVMSQEVFDAVAGPGFDPDEGPDPCEILAEYCDVELDDRFECGEGKNPVIGFAVGVQCEGTLPACVSLASLPAELADEITAARQSYCLLAEYLRECFSVELPVPELFLMEVERA